MLHDGMNGAVETSAEILFWTQLCCTSGLKGELRWPGLVTGTSFHDGAKLSEEAHAAAITLFPFHVLQSKLCTQLYRI
eukprot:scaffold19025_cov20-Tisochrysis_lutea.AAC.5